MADYQLDWIDRWAEYLPRRMAFREHRRGWQWSYREFNERVETLSWFLVHQTGLRQGDRLAVLSRNRAEYVFLFFAAMKAGIILVPLNFRCTAAELKQMLQDCTPKLLLFESDFATVVSDLNGLHINHARLDTITSFLSASISGKRQQMDANLTFDDPVMILYTSGTTGTPKGAIITHKMLFWNSINTGLRLNITSDDHAQSFAPFFHTGGWNVLLTPFVHHGASHTLLDGFDADLILELLEKERATLIFGVPTMMQMLADAPGFMQADLSSVRYAIVGGAPMPLPLIDIWSQKGVPIRQGYGLTEVGPNTFSLHQDDAERKKGSIGSPNFYISARVVDADGRNVPTNTPGELWLKSPVVTPGYWNRPQETARAITDGWFHTGDMVRRDADGYFYVVDRKKNMFISGGENVYPAEVEKVLNTHPAIKESAVVGVPHPKWGEVGLAFLVGTASQQIEDDELIVYCRQHLAGYKIPKAFRWIDALPRNDSGKINRKTLEQLTNQEDKS